MKIKMNKKGNVTVSGVEGRVLSAILSHSALAIYDRMDDPTRQEHRSWYANLLEETKKMQEELKAANFKAGF